MTPGLERPRQWKRGRISDRSHQNTPDQHDNRGNPTASDVSLSLSPNWTLIEPSSCTGPCTTIQSGAYFEESRTCLLCRTKSRLVVCSVSMLCLGTQGFWTCRSLPTQPETSQADLEISSFRLTQFRFHSLISRPTRALARDTGSVTGM
jgi:hypothetical protein